jgi:hypothetical protein
MVKQKIHYLVFLIITVLIYTLSALIFLNLGQDAVLDLYSGGGPQTLSANIPFDH